jgi:hypothetical protein
VAPADGLAGLVVRPVCWRCGATADVVVEEEWPMGGFKGAVLFAAAALDEHRAECPALT